MAFSVSRKGRTMTMKISFARLSKIIATAESANAASREALARSRDVRHELRRVRDRIDRTPQRDVTAAMRAELSKLEQQVADLDADYEFALAQWEHAVRIRTRAIEFVRGTGVELPNHIRARIDR